jgi:hypothetical protein
LLHSSHQAISSAIMRRIAASTSSTGLFSSHGVRLCQGMRSAGTRPSCASSTTAPTSNTTRARKDPARRKVLDRPAAIASPAFV